METTKPWYHSKTVWGGLVAIAASLLQALGADFTLADQAALSESLVSLAGAVGGILAIYGRLAARTEISSDRS